MPNSDSMLDRLEFVWEQWHPTIVASLAAGLSFFFFNLSGIEGFRDLLQAAVNISAITVGFLATSKSILFTIAQKETVLAMKDAGKWPMLIDYMMLAIYSAFSLALVSGGLLLVKFKDPEEWHPVVASVWVFCLVIAFTTSLRIVRFFARILKMK